MAEDRALTGDAGLSAYEPGEQRRARYDVFLSYSQSDRPIAFQVAEQLHENGIRVWWDVQLHASEAFDRQILRVLSGSAVVVALLSPQALTSDWVRWELGQAHDAGLAVIACLIRGARRTALGPELRRAEVIEFDSSRSEGAVSALTALVQELLANENRGDIATDTSPTKRAMLSEARRRLASAAADAAREATSIKRRDARVEFPNPLGHVEGQSQSKAQTCRVSGSMADLLEELDVSIAFTSSQASRLFMLGRNPQNGAALLSRQAFRRPTGICMARGSLLLATHSEILRLESTLAAGERFDGVFERCYIPRTRHYTGFLDAHDIGAPTSAEVFFANTRYDCVAALSSRHSFSVLWKPWWISELQGDDRCHLNGLALWQGEPAFITALAMTNSENGWRDHLADGGVLVDIRRNAVLCRGLSMPHSPRMHDGRLWFLNSGRGDLRVVEAPERATAAATTVAFCPGFARGLALHGPYAFVGISLPRDGSVQSLFLEERLKSTGSEAYAGLVVVDTRSGDIVAWVRFLDGTREIFDVAIIPGVTSGVSLGFMNHDTPGEVSFES